MVVGFIAFVLIAYNGPIDLPGSGTEEVGVTKDWGYYVALLAAAGIAAAGIGRSDGGAAGRAGDAEDPGTVQDPRPRVPIRWGPWESFRRMYDPGTLA